MSNNDRPELMTVQVSSIGPLYDAGVAVAKEHYEPIVDGLRAERDMAARDAWMRMIYAASPPDQR